MVIGGNGFSNLYSSLLAIEFVMLMTGKSSHVKLELAVT